MDDLSAALRASPELFPFAFDARRDAVSFLHLTRVDYDAASFLDDRLLARPRPRRDAPWALVAAAAAAVSQSCGYIFHMGHVGSTLLSRLLGCDRRVLALREPAILRMFAQLRANPAHRPATWSETDFANRLSTFVRLWSRTFAPDERVVLKATSFATELAPELLSGASAPRAVLMHVSAESYLATILGAENSPIEMRALAALRRQRLSTYLRADLPALTSLSTGEMAAMSWACEMCALMRARRVAQERTLSIDFDAFLAQPSRMLKSAFEHFGIQPSDDQLHAAVTGPLMRQYSKAPEHAYDSQLRRAVLDEGRRLFGGEIRRGLVWLEQMAVDHSALAQAMCAQ